MEYKYKLSEKLLQCYSSIYCLKLRKSRGESPHCFMILLNCIFKVQTINKLNPFEKKKQKLPWLREYRANDDPGL